MGETTPYEPKVGDHVVATWKTKTGRTKSVHGTVQRVTEKRVQVRYERTSSSGRNFSWAVCETWRPRDQVRPTKAKPETMVPVIDALFGVERDRVAERKAGT